MNNFFRSITVFALLFSVCNFAILLKTNDKISNMDALLKVISKDQIIESYHKNQKIKEALKAATTIEQRYTDYKAAKTQPSF